MRITRLVGLAVLVGCGGGGDVNDAGTDGQPSDGAVADQASDAGDGSVVNIPGLDTSFGNGGVATAGFPGGIGAFVHVTRQSDGAIVAIGGTQESIVIARTKADGTFDTSFGSGGAVQLPWGLVTNGVTGGVYDVAMQADGKIVAASRVLASFSQNAFPRSVVVRLDSDGSFDTSFNQTGMIIGDPKTATYANAVAIQSNGGVVVGGNDLRRYTSSGAADTAFGTNGVTISNYGISGIALQPDDAIVTVGYKDVSRFDTTGKLDATFGTAGKITITSTGNGDNLYAAAIQSDGKILVAGTLKLGAATQSAFSVGRLTSAGAIDATFGTSGFTSDGSTQSQSVAFGVGVQPDGHVVASGAALVNGLRQVVRLSTTGVIDSTYGGGGSGFTDFGNLVVDPAGDVVIGGATLTGFTFAPTLERFAPSGGSDSTFGTGGLATKGIGGAYDRANAVAFQPDGKLVVGGTTASGKLALVRFDANGSPDSSFPTISSPSMQDVNTIAVQSTGKILVGGFNGFSSSPLGLRRFDGAGVLDTTFGASGVVTAPLTFTESFVLDASGKILLVGAAQISGGYEYAVARLTADGAVDATFGASGAALTAFGPGAVNVGVNAVVQANGSIVVLGASGTSQNSNSSKLVRFTSAGVLDATFGTAGVVAVSTGSPFALAQQTDGKLIVVSMGQFGSSALTISRFTADGAVDASFGTSGATTFAFGGNDYYGLQAPMGLAIQSDGKIFVGLASSSDGLVETAVLLRLGTDGMPDASFGTAGVRSFAALSPRGSSSLHGLAFDGNGKLVIVGRAWNETGASDFVVLRMVP